MHTKSLTAESAQTLRNALKWANERFESKQVMTKEETILLERIVMVSAERIRESNQETTPPATDLRLHPTAESAHVESRTRIQSLNQETANETTKAVNAEEPGILFALIPDDQTRTMILCPIDEGQTSIKLTEKTAKILISMLDHQIQEWL